MAVLGSGSVKFEDCPQSLPSSAANKMACRRLSNRAVITEGNAVPSGTTSARSERAKRFAALRSASSLRLSERHSEDVGTIKELDEAIKGARRALRDFARVTPPHMSTARAFYFGNCVCTFRFLLQ